MNCARLVETILKTARQKGANDDRDHSYRYDVCAKSKLKLIWILQRKISHEWREAIFEAKPR